MNEELSEKDSTSEGKQELEFKNINPPDGGYGWVIVACSTTMLVMFAGSSDVLAIYLPHFSDQFNKPQASMGTLGSVGIVILSFTGILSTSLSARYGCRVVCVVGVLIAFVATLASAFVHTYGQLMLTLSVIRNFGMGLYLILVRVIVQEYFTKNKSLAEGITSAGLGLGDLFWPPMHRLMMYHYGWRGALFFYSAFVLQSAVCAALLRPLSTNRLVVQVAGVSSQDLNTGIRDVLERVEKDDNAVDKIKNDTSDVCDNINTKNAINNRETHGQRNKIRSIRTTLRKIDKVLSISVFRSPLILVYCTSRSLRSAAYYTVLTFWYQRAVTVGIDPVQAAFLMSVMGLTSTVSRFGGGAIGNCKCVNRLVQYTACELLAGITLIMSCLITDQYLGFILYHAIYGIFQGGCDGINVTVIRDIAGLALLPAVSAWSNAVGGLFTFAAIPLAGWLYDVTGSYATSFVVVGVIQVIGGLIFIYIVMSVRRRHHLFVSTHDI